VLADSIEHACNLASQLPGWPVVAGEDIDLSGLRYQQRRLLAERGPTWLTGNQQIVTTCAASNLRLSSPDVIIWAGGGLHRPPIPRKWLHCPAGSNHRILLIDCDDRHHVELEAWTCNRRLEYVESDWFDVGVDSTSGRIIRFLHQPNRRNR
jgi:hypothetical protein